MTTPVDDMQDTLVWDPVRWPNFTRSNGEPEHWIRCRHTGLLRMAPDFLDKIQTLRNIYGFPMYGTSGYRHPTHPIEAAKASPGPHSTGRAADFGCSHESSFRLLEAIVKSGLFTGIGLHQKGTGRFIHVDDLPESPGMPRPTTWTY